VRPGSTANTKEVPYETHFDQDSVFARPRSRRPGRTNGPGGRRTQHVLPGGYAGNYDDTRVKALAALKANQPVQLSVLFSIDVFELMDQDVLVPFDEVATSGEDKQWLSSFYPALMENSKAKGKIWGVPFQRSTIVM
jgi:hypothetical protein